MFVARRMLVACAATCAAAGLAQAGPYADEVGLHKSDTSIHAWATGFADLVRGPQDASVESSPPVSFGVGDNALGVPGDVFDTVSLGDGGRITLTFARPIGDGPGADFAVFENAFIDASTGGLFAELGHVEVSSDGVNFFRFPSVSLTPTATQVDTFGSIDPTDVHNLAGKSEIDTGTPFDLSDLLSLPGAAAGLNVHDVTHVRVIDAIGSVDPLLGTVDSLGNLINDAFTTPFSNGGFDLNAIGVLHEVLQGDANFDRQVNALDLSIVASHWQQAGDFAGGDFNHDGQINALDLSVLASHWNSSAAGRADFDEAVAFTALGGVPEPASGLLILAGGALACARRPRFAVTRSAAR